MNFIFLVAESVFKNYAGDNSELQRTQDFLENVFQSGAATCLICIATVKRTEPVGVLIDISEDKNSILMRPSLFRYGHVSIASAFSIYPAYNDGPTIQRL